jgi:hypothetical protein
MGKFSNTLVLGTAIIGFAPMPAHAVEDYKGPFSTQALYTMCASKNPALREKCNLYLQGLMYGLRVQIVMKDDGMLVCLPDNMTTELARQNLIDFINSITHGNPSSNGDSGDWVAYMSLESGGSLTGGHNLCPGQKTPQSDQSPPSGSPDRGDVITHHDADQEQDQSKPHPFNITKSDPAPNGTTRVTVTSTVDAQTINDLTVNNGKCSLSNHGDLPVSLKLNQSHAFYASCNPLTVEVNTNLAHMSAGWPK